MIYLNLIAFLVLFIAFMIIFIRYIEDKISRKYNKKSKPKNS